MSTLIRLLSVAVLATAFTAGAQAQQSPPSASAFPSATEKIFDVVKQVAARDGLEIKLVKFNDYQLPNAALNAGDLDANAFQHKPFLDNQIKARGFDIVPVGLTVTAPLGFYSRKIKALGDLPEGASVGIQNDPSNGNRALRLLAAYKLITLKPEAEQKNNATPQDVVSNPRKLKLVPLDAAQLPRSLDDLTAAAINNDYADQAGLVPARDAIGREAADGPYANLIAVRAKDRDQPWVRSWWRLTSRPRSAPSSRKNSRARWCPRSDASGSLFRIPDIRRHTAASSPWRAAVAAFPFLRPAAPRRQPAARGRLEHRRTGPARHSRRRADRGPLRQPRRRLLRARVAAADAVLISTPVYKASFAGGLKAVLDLLDEKALAGKVVLPIATGGSPAHLLALEYGLKPVLSALGARHILAGVYATDKQVRVDEAGQPHIDDDVRQRLEDSVDRLSEQLRPHAYVANEAYDLGRLALAGGFSV